MSRMVGGQRMLDIADVGRVEGDDGKRKGQMIPPEDCVHGLAVGAEHDSGCVGGEGVCGSGFEREHVGACAWYRHMRVLVLAAGSRYAIRTCC
eukprot:3908079-Rhodomonas_salina.1